MEEYRGTEKRNGCCPVHHIKCDEWTATSDNLKTKVPIWVFRIFLTVLIVVLGAMNFTYYRQSEIVLSAVENHIETSTRILDAMSHGLTEVAINQRTVMNKLALKYESLPHYESE